MSDLISAQASNLISKVIPGFDVSADFQSANGNDIQKSRTILTASKKLFNERLEIQTSFSLDGQSIGNSNIMGQYNITPDGNLKFRAYNRSSSNGGVYNSSGQISNSYNPNIITQGIGLYYRKEFDKFNELFKRKNAKIVLPN